MTSRINRFTGAHMIIWVVTDGRAGNENQALGLAEAISRNSGAQIVLKRVQLSALWARLSFPLTPRNAFDHLGECVADFPDDGPDIWIGCGRQSVMLTLAARRRYPRAFRIQILSPGAPLSMFDLVVAPQHDGLSGGNVLSMIGAPNRLNDDVLEKLAAEFAGIFSGVPRPRIALLIGGPNKRFAFHEHDQSRILQIIDDLIAAGAGILATASRRTPTAFVERLSMKLRDTSNMFYDCETPGIRNPYPALLGACDFVLATADSVNMISEAASGPAPVFVLPLERKTKRENKFDRWLKSLVAQDCVRIFDGKLEHWSRNRLDETARVAAEVLAVIERSRAR